ncbi:MAG: putative GH25 family protein [Gammaproteobacteria bacterium]|jgi:uncharacterized GH25 family protein
MLLRSINLLCILLITTPVYAHEFWISPKQYEVAVDEPISANFRVGQSFSGSKQSFLKQRTTQHAFARNGVVTTLSGRNGDRPAMQISGLPDGLVILLHETTNSTLKYKEYEKFESFVKHKAFDSVLEDHQARGLPDTGFRESYRRYAKSLIAVGNGAGNDLSIGLEIEIVALANPYTDDIAGGLPVLVLLAGKPRLNAQVELFARSMNDNQEVKVTLHRTNSMGIALLPVENGYEYMVDHVALKAVEPKNSYDPVWHSLWANLTFYVPDQ